MLYGVKEGMFIVATSQIYQWAWKHLTPSLIIPQEVMINNDNDTSVYVFKPFRIEYLITNILKANFAHVSKPRSCVHSQRASTRGKTTRY